MTDQPTQHDPWRCPDCDRHLPTRSLAADHCSGRDARKEARRQERQP